MAAPAHLEIIPLGGLGEFGMNLLVYRWGDDCVVVDAGMMFPGAEHLGVDVVVPDLSFLDDCGTIHGLVLTHGHEDHIGAVPHVLARHDLPVYATPYTAGLVRARLEEHPTVQARALRDLPEDGRLEAWRALDPRFTGVHDAAANPHRAIVSLETSQHVLVVCPATS